MGEHNLEGVRFFWLLADDRDYPAGAQRGQGQTAARQDREAPAPAQVGVVPGPS